MNLIYLLRTSGGTENMSREQKPRSMKSEIIINELRMDIVTQKYCEGDKPQKTKSLCVLTQAAARCAVPCKRLKARDLFGFF